ncbi:hypothetical protein BO71DRAFT_422788 [Aspergillus ellipticus CBS 707.79]|uniref:Chitin deacetylase n=1 Tax=Aspergillus ellipticus CBS 707.79 TaxID=1448320 RepID=A0A319EFC6_9EURO|nr:hypothetical protein BO71DRAFT_422788 [Aspergillus ellipticus CBS 707.79]
MATPFPIEQCIAENIAPSPGYRVFDGYKGRFPGPQWPGQAKLCVNIVLNYEEGGGGGGEYSVLNGDLHSETDLQEMIGRPVRHGQRDIQRETQYEYGTRVRVWRVAPDAARFLVDSGHEIASHGYCWINHHSCDPGPDRPAASGLALVCYVYSQQGLELLYQCDSYADELPYWAPHPIMPDRGLLMISYTYDVNDNKFCTSPGFVNPRDWLNYCKAAFDVLYKEGCRGESKMMTIGLHSRLIGQPACCQALRVLINYTQRLQDVWFATRKEIARHWIQVACLEGG